MGSLTPPLDLDYECDSKWLSNLSASSSSHYTRDAYLSSLDPERFRTTYETTKAVMRGCGLTVEDIVNMTDKFWNMYFDGVAIVDSSAAATFSIHTNLVIGTIVPHAKKQPNLLPLLEQLMNFDICGKFLLTEVGRGLDARNIETTATLSRDGESFDFHTPFPAAAKSMPPTTPMGGVPKVAVVFAQLVIDGEKQGVRAFVVHLTDGSRMCRGVTSRLLPPRPGIKPLDYAITTFNHVTLDRNCLLGELHKSGDQRTSFFQEIHRISVGSLAISLANVPALKSASYLAYSFSRRRMVTDSNSKLPISILSFPTQYGPIISTAAHAVVMEAAGRVSISVYQTPGVPDILRAALSCIFKATITWSTQRYLNELTDRCGWRGLYAHSRISEIQLSLKGNSIAEGDVLVLCIRLASELVQGKYPLPPSDNPHSLLARREQGLFGELQAFATKDESGNSNHRSAEFAQNVTPRARDLIQAIGQRLAYDSVIESGTVRQELIDVWESNCILEDPTWYVEHAGMTSREIHARHVAALERTRPHLEAIINDFGMEKYMGSTTLVSSENEDEFMRSLPTFGEEAAQTHGISNTESPPNQRHPEKSTVEVREEYIDHDSSDRTSAQNWSLTKRCLVAAVISLYTFVVYAASAIYIIGLPEIMQEFDIGEQEALLGLSLYVLAYGLGPMVWSPISELPWIGRRPVYSLTFVAFLCFSVLAATAQSWEGFLVIRFFQAFFGSPCLATGGASMHDLFPHSTVPFSLTVWIAAAFCGPALGPVLAGYVVPEKGWHLGMWEIAYMAGPICLLLLLIPETYEPAIKAKRTKALRDEIQDSMGPQQTQQGPSSSKHVQALLSSLRDAIIVPFQIAILDPSVAVANAYTSFIYATYYTLFDAIPRVYPQRYNFTAGELGLSFLHVFVACVIAGLIYCTYVHKVLNPANRQGRLTTHEDRLRPALIACFLPPVGLILFAWTSDGKIHWIVGLIGLTLYSMGTFVILQCLSVYTPRIYPLHSASLFASNDFCRSSLAAGAIHFGVPLYRNLGVAHGVSVLAGLLVLGVPGVWFIYWRGANLRAKSRFVAPKAVLEEAGRTLA